MVQNVKLLINSCSKIFHRKGQPAVDSRGRGNEKGQAIGISHSLITYYSTTTTCIVFLVQQICKSGTIVMLSAGGIGGRSE